MRPEDLDERLAREPAIVDCAICRHRQWLRAPAGRCDQCASEIRLHVDREAAAEERERFEAEGRVAFVVPSGGPSGVKDLHAVVVNRKFVRG